MTFEEALEFIESALESKTSKTLSLLEKEILKAAWENATYSVIADSFYLSIGHIKDLAAVLWQRISDLIGEKITKNNFRSLVEKQSTKNAIANAKGDRRFAANAKVGESDLHQLETCKGNIVIVDDLPENLRFLTHIPQMWVGFLYQL